VPDITGDCTDVEPKLEHRDGIAWVTLERADASEASLAEDDARELLRALGRLASERVAPAVVLTSDGPDLCIGHRAGPTPSLADERRALSSEPYRSLLLTLAYLDVPTVAAVRGRALGIGLGLALACDVVLTDDHARLGRAFASLGELLGAGGQATLVKRPGLIEALGALGDRRRPLGAKDAERRGIVNQAVSSSELLPTAAATATILASGPVESWRTVRALARLSDARLHPGLAGQGATTRVVQAAPDSPWGLERVAVPARSSRRRSRRRGSNAR
jgi:2-(1,2-epoxy-1,2-dihydrophenyl)acetyl-CoA isomerase